MQSLNKKNTLIVIAILIIGSFARLIPGIHNFSPIVGLALFGGAFLGSRLLAFAAPFAAIYFSDLIINNTIARAYFPDVEGLVLWSNYMTFGFIAYALIVLVGIFGLQKKSFGRVIAASVASSLIFYFVTNIGATFMPTSLYSPGLAGVGQSLMAGIPFLQNSLLGDLLFTGVFFGSFFLISKPATGTLQGDKVSVK